MKSVLIRLLNNRNYISGEELAQSLDLSRTAVWKQVNKLKESGFVIESVHKTGYRLTGVPDEKIVPELVEYYYGGQLPLELIEIEQVDSTNTFAKKTLLDKNCLQLVIAEEQTCGKGRLSRVWESSKGKDLTFSIVCPSERNINDFYKYTVIAAVSVYYAIVPLIKENNADMKIKWPNDIYINQKKVCGILSEMITEEMKIKNMIVGIGVNVNSNPYMEKAVSIKQISNSAENRNKLLAEIIRNFNKYMELWNQGQYDLIFHLWKNNLGWLGLPIRIDTGRGIVSGVFKDIRNDGAIIIESNNEEKVFYSGDLTT